MSVIEVPFVSPRTAEALLARAKQAQAEGRTAFASRGLRAARARDGKLLLTVEKALTLCDKTNEAQNGQTQRSSGTGAAYRIPPVQLQFIRSAYEALDRHKPDGSFDNLVPFAWYYGAAAELAFGG